MSSNVEVGLDFMALVNSVGRDKESEVVLALDCSTRLKVGQ